MGALGCGRGWLLERKGLKNGVYYWDLATKYGERNAF